MVHLAREEALKCRNYEGFDETGEKLHIIYLSIDPYIPFVFMGGILVGIVENTLLWKNETNTDENGGYFWYINVLWGVGLIFLPHVRIFYNYILSDCEKEVVYLCYGIYFLLGLEKIFFEIKEITQEKKHKIVT